jgi:two-component system alkaline phosphatase synthesis response regulator PhoP
VDINQQKHHILIVDDEPEVHTVLGKMLVREGYAISSAYSADEAFDKVKSSKPDLIILDIMMPKVSGIEVCNRLKGDPATKDILILIVSARDAQADRIEGLTHGADDYVSKPFHLRSLVRKIEHMLQKHREEEFEASIKSE